MRKTISAALGVSMLLVLMFFYYSNQNERTVWQTLDMTEFLSSR
ncbi:hypothetical protein [Thermococcus sp. MV5]|nr:hypothetical protein [Thermococcus sp. MV5]